MKFTAIATLAAAAAISLSAHAATGMPSEQETGSQRTCEPSVPVTQDAQVGSYARYLMLNGKPREQALAEAFNIDHPAASHFAGHQNSPQAAVTEAPANAAQQ
jgi:hypothetical protein